MDRVAGRGAGGGGVRGRRRLSHDRARLLERAQSALSPRAVAQGSGRRHEGVDREPGRRVWLRRRRRRGWTRVRDPPRHPATRRSIVTTTRGHQERGGRLKESVGSLRAYFAVVGILGLLQGFFLGLASLALLVVKPLI